LTKSSANIWVPDRKTNNCSHSLFFPGQPVGIRHDEAIRVPTKEIGCLTMPCEAFRIPGKEKSFRTADYEIFRFLTKKSFSQQKAVGTDGMRIGITDDISEMLSDDTLRLGSGDCMVLFTDGITEAWDRGTACSVTSV